MHWIIQNNLHKEAGHELLVNSIKKRKIPYDIVDVIPFEHKLKQDINPTNPCIAIGSWTLGTIAKNKGWNPGVYINENFTYEIYIKHWGNKMLNYDGIVTTFGEPKFPSEFIKEKTDKIFVRPCDDGKVFSGQINTFEQLIQWKTKVKQMMQKFELGKNEGIQPDKKILIAPVKEIFNEYRFFIVDGKVITGSAYKCGEVVKSSLCIDKNPTEFAQKMTDIWQPDKAFVMDICSTIEGYKIIEINSLNSSGFYLCDMDKVVEALEEMEN